MKRRQLIPLPPLTLDRRHPLAPQIAAAIRIAIDTGRFPIGARLPATRTFAEACGVSRQVMVSAFEELAFTGDICGRIGAGSYVSRSRPRSLPSRTLRDPDGHPIAVAPLEPAL